MLDNEKIRKMYNNIITSKYNNNYEFNRWFLNDRLRLDYFMMHMSIEYFLKNLYFDSILEIGPGPGTWTRLIFKNINKNNYTFDLVDISKEMRNQFFLEMRDLSKVNYMVDDFMKLNSKIKNYNFIFSSRAIEYFDDKDSFLKKIYNLLDDDGFCIIITKNPKSYIGKNKRWQHSDNISYEKMNLMLKNIGFKDIKFYPVIIRIPILDRFCIKFSEKFYTKVYNKTINKYISFFTESYLVIFKK